MKIKDINTKTPISSASPSTGNNVLNKTRESEKNNTIKEIIYINECLLKCFVSNSDSVSVLRKN